jgi:hypothetical protein
LVTLGLNVIGKDKDNTLLLIVLCDIPKLRLSLATLTGLAYLSTTLTWKL